MSRVKILDYTVYLRDMVGGEKSIVLGRRATREEAVEFAANESQDRCDTGDRFVREDTISKGTNLPVNEFRVVMADGGVEDFVIAVVARVKKPAPATLEKWMRDGVARAMDGCKVEPDGYCPHGCKSWLLVLGLI